LFFYIRETNNSGANNTETVKNNNGSIELHIPITDGNRYEVYGEINNYRVLFLVDTGATGIAVPQSVAKKANLIQGMPVKIITAGGHSKAYLTKIKNLRIGNDIMLHNINATINTEMVDNTVLLGMGAIKQLNVKFDDNTLILIKK
jgi:aspartyl protease family protein